MQRKTEEKELGFGTKTSTQRTRLINKNGSFNVERIEVSRWQSVSIYHALITMSWRRFNFFVFLYFIIINLIFAVSYLIAGLDGLIGIHGTSFADRFLEAFFFSTQTFSTVGFGRISPGNHLVSSIAAIESLAGLLGFALATGLLYGRFSRPVVRVLFSKNAIIAPFKNGSAFQFRIANKMRNSQVSNLECQVTVAKLEIENGVPIRRFRSLKLELKSIVFFPMSWTINHVIDEDSPLYKLTAEDMEKADVEFLILLTGFNDTFSQTVTARYSYTYEELVYGARFISIFGQNDKGQTTQDLNKLSDYEIAPVPVEAIA
ncbi:MAG TPA: ion channel [Bacteroidia bacterium]|jgi:inward rectifier potassium channel|nr:ion channel [Bacteroidia bacterium]